MLRVELVAHMDAGDRTLWPGVQDERPLSDLGHAQARRLADALSQEPFEAIYSSPALRCLQTVKPIALRFALPVNQLEELRETDGYLLPESWQYSKAAAPRVLGSAYAAGRALAALRIIQSREREGRVLVCSHGDVLPVLLALLRGSEGLEFPAPHEQRGGWETIMIEQGHTEIYQHPLIEDFPH
jgi:broad specificity phosphatase PhoE